VKEIRRGLRRLGWHFDRVHTSPWARAARTSELLQRLSSSDARTTDSTRPIAARRSVVADRRVRVQPHARRATAVVGHQPWLGELVAWLAFGDSRHHDALVLKKAGVAWLEGTPTPGGMSLRALMPPSMLRRSNAAAACRAPDSRSFTTRATWSSWSSSFDSAPVVMPSFCAVVPNLELGRDEQIEELGDPSPVLAGQPRLRTERRGASSDERGKSLRESSRLPDSRSRARAP